MAYVKGHAPKSFLIFGASVLFKQSPFRSALLWFVNADDPGIQMPREFSK
jgi:hypothetical protein